MHYLKQTWDETKPPAWLLYFVCRSLLCWQIYGVRLAGSHQRSNNLLQVLAIGGHLPCRRLTLAAVMRSKTMMTNLLSFASDPWPPALEQPEVQQQLFQWDGLDLVKSHAVVDFLAELSGRKLVILSATNEVLHTSADAPLDWPTVAIRCGHTDYIIQRRDGEENQGDAKKPQGDPLYLTAFAHVSSRTLAHTGVFHLIAQMLEVMRRPNFWDQAFTAARYCVWAEQLRKAHQDIAVLVNEYKRKEDEWGLPTRTDQPRRPPVPPLEELTAGVQRILALKDERGWHECDVRTKMSVPAQHPTRPGVKLNLKDLRPSEKNPIPHYMFIIGGNSFTRGTTLSEPLVTLFTRFSDNQEELTQYMRMLGHRKPEAIDLMCAVGGYLQEVKFAKLWSTMAKNIVLLIDSWASHAGAMDADKAPGLLQTSGMQAAPRQHMRYASVRPASEPLSQIKITDPPLRGDKNHQLFHQTNKLFAFLMGHYGDNIHMPGLLVRKYPPYPQYPKVFPYSSPGIVFRDVLVDEEFLRFFRDQESLYSPGKRGATSFPGLIHALEDLRGSTRDRISVCLANTKANVERMRRFTQKYRAAMRSEAGTTHLLDFVMPFRIQRKEPPYDRFSGKQDFRTLSCVDAVLLRPKTVGGSQQEVIPAFEHYVVKKEGNKFKRSSSAPPLLIVALLDPEFKELAHSRSVLHQEKDCADYPPTAYMFLPRSPKSSTFSFAYPSHAAPSATRARKRARPG